MILLIYRQESGVEGIVTLCNSIKSTLNINLGNLGETLDDLNGDIFTSCPKRARIHLYEESDLGLIFETAAAIVPLSIGTTTAALDSFFSSRGYTKIS